ncbi:uncharacterized protein BDR25DRAFT_354704 [Lindgomyces ingoldianus]|uniref:Uncharacterized protein n=1 Tax=Lindgomyces ingoldianus TaxID=673940 RepID=A0ACB6QX30_9PLEO|nr:uncharacterized protein BDR25DRAFT_354704 [Lindgomyces ingoldianus]KAF2471466.1 hypothetical protein BDR25DRAFT_354704 [Lindgomyces ingoldianus]
MLQAEQKAEQHDPETVLQSDTWIRVLQGAHRTFHRRNSGGGLLALNSRGTMFEVLVFAQEIIIRGSAVFMLTKERSKLR